MLALAVAVLVFMLKSERGKVRDLGRDLTSAKSESVQLAKDKDALKLAAKSLKEVAEAVINTPSNISEPESHKAEPLEAGDVASFPGVNIDPLWVSAARECLKNEKDDAKLMTNLRQASADYKKERDAARAGRRTWRWVAVGAVAVGSAIIILD